jgi:hypothetical protein
VADKPVATCLLLAFFVFYGGLLMESDKKGSPFLLLTVDTYSHVLPSLQGDAMDKMNDLFGRNEW